MHTQGIKSSPNPSTQAMLLRKLTPPRCSILQRFLTFVRSESTLWQLREVVRFLPGDGVKVSRCRMISVLNDGIYNDVQRLTFWMPQGVCENVQVYSTYWMHTLMLNMFLFDAMQGQTSEKWTCTQASLTLCATHPQQAHRHTEEQEWGVRAVA